jgi:5'-nucleotidase
VGCGRLVTVEEVQPAPRVLVTNDDGIDSEGLRVLADTAVGLGLSVTVVAPSWDNSGVGTSVVARSENGRVVAERRKLDTPTVDWIGVHAAPSFIIRAAVHGAFGAPPDVVLSGINLGANIGRGVMHSATIGAAMTAASYGRSAMAISLAESESADWRWDTAAEVARAVIAWLLKTSRVTVLNVNVPDRPVDALRGLRATRLTPGGKLEGHVATFKGGFVPLDFIEPAGEAHSKTDTAALADGYASVTALRPISEDFGVDLAGLADFEEPTCPTGEP